VAGVVRDLKISERQMDMEKLAEFLAALPKLLEMGEHVLKSSLLDDLPKVIDARVGMINAGMLHKEVVATLGDLGIASVSTFEAVKQQNPPPISGLWATMRAMKDPEVQQTMGFAFPSAKAFAKHLK